MSFQLHTGDSLTYPDILLLRKIVKKGHFRHYPKELMTDHEADKCIYSLTPKIKEQLIKTFVDGNFEYK